MNSANVSLDVRTLAHKDRLATVLRAWAALAPGATLTLVVDLDPLPLHALLQAQERGAFAWDYIERGPDRFEIALTRLVRAESQPGVEPREIHEPVPFLDVRGLEPPEPMMRILEALAECPPGGQLQARLDRKPIHLLAELPARGVEYSCTEYTEGGWLLELRRR